MAKVFQILVPDNTLVSRIIMCENQVTELFVIDRADKKFVSDYSNDLNKPALYILVNRDKRQLYVGETDDSIKRLRNHEAKDFWTEAIVFHSTTDTLSTTEVKWLEAKTYEALKELGYYDLSENKQVPQQPPLKRNQIYTLEPIFEEAKNYICAAGFDIFLKKKVEEEAPQPQEPAKKEFVEQNNVWLLPSSRKRFNLEACFAEYGEVYWRISSNFKRIAKGDRGYVYSSDPDKAILYRFDVIESQMSYSKVMDRDEKFSNGKGESNKEYGAKGGLFVLIRVNGTLEDKRFSLPILLKNGLKGAPQCAIRISQDEYKPLLDFIDANFETTPVDANVAKKPRRAPFKFSMIGLKPGDTIIFAPNGEEVRVNSENTVDYDGQILTLSRFCKIYMPDVDSENKEYQGPAHFTYNGKTLDEIRKENEK
ncbi:MAG: GIY-YIG nuclease family protein [Bacteroidaceae bacterium]|nr:GIY-YIG nuclease family protein [Bacteroidaceae bacterium]